MREKGKVMREEEYLSLRDKGLPLDRAETGVTYRKWQSVRVQGETMC